MTGGLLHRRLFSWNGSGPSPTALKLMRAESLPESTVDTMASQWLHLNYVRAALTLAGWIATLKAFSIPSEPCG